MRSTSPAASVFVFAIALSAAAVAGCDFKHDPAKMVTIEVTGVANDAQRDRVQDAVKKWVDGSSHMMTTMSSGDKLSIDLSPVTDVDAFAKKIDFGEVSKVEGRKVSVTFKP
jgi:ABC-type uncharacterized transport system auxiliary subunit